MNIFEYIKGTKRGKSAHEFEENLMRDPFLAEAMEGYDKVRGNHELIIAKLQKKVSRKTKRKKFKHPKFIWSGIAASIAIVAFIAFYFTAGFHLQQTETTSTAGRQRLTQDETVDSAEYNNRESANEEKKNTVDGKKDDSQNQTYLSQSHPLKNGNARIGGQSSKEETFGHQQVEATNLQEAKTAKDDHPNITTSETDTHALNIQGVVKDEKGNPLMGVKIKTTDNPTEFYTDVSGKFNIKVTYPGQMIQFGYLGFQPVEMPVPVSIDQPLIVIMKEHEDLLNEQVIIAKDKWETKKGDKAPLKAEPSGGFKEYSSYIRKNRSQPNNPECKALRGKVKIRFSTDENGRPCNIRVVHELCSELDQQAIRLINKGPSWTPNAEDIEYEVSF
jgi:hypothetical protein